MSAGSSLDLGTRSTSSANSPWRVPRCRYSWADVTGKVQEQAAEVHQSGLADGRFKVSINLKGNDAMTPREFAAAPRGTVIGASLTVAAPAGQYLRDEVD